MFFENNNDHHQQQIFLVTYEIIILDQYTLLFFIFGFPVFYCHYNAPDIPILEHSVQLCNTSHINMIDRGICIRSDHLFDSSPVCIQL